jgi:56kDa selenium binding protein (SBP56)
MVQISRDGRRVYVTNSLYAAWDEVFYPDGVGAWMAKLDADVSAGGLVADIGFFPRGDDFRGRRVHQIRRHCQLEQSEGDFRRFASAIHQVACDVCGLCG